MKNVLITGQNSYIGNAIATYLEQYAGSVENPKQYQVTKISLRDDAWKKLDFSDYDCVLHVAGKAHVDVAKVDEETKQSYYHVNARLAEQVATKAKEAGVKQFIQFSSVIVYGDGASVGCEKMIGQDTLPTPANFYGDSKWQGEQAVQRLSDDNFSVAVLRLPFIYGKSCKGNYPLLVKLAEKLPVFPAVKNQRSMLYIENLTEFVRQLVEDGVGGIFHPQNGTYVTTARMVQEIGQVQGKKIRMWRVLHPVVKMASAMPGKIGKLVNKAFGSMTVDMALSDYGDNSYRKYSFEESIRRIHED